MAQQDGETVLSDNDWKRFSRALLSMKEDTIIRTLEHEEITVQTLLTPRVWPVAIIVQVRYRSPHLDWSQNYESVEEARRCLTHILRNDEHR